MQRRFLFLVNQKAGTRSKDGLIDYLKQRTNEAGIQYEFLTNMVDASTEVLQQKLHAYNATDLVVCGGDGTVNLGAQAVIDTNINLGVIPVGSGNGLARSAGISTKPGAALRTILKGRIEKTDAFLINDKFSCMLSGIGLDAAVAHSFAKGNGRGLYNYTLKSISEFIKASPFHFTLKTDSLIIDSQAFFISVANSNQFGNNFTIAPKASLHDGLLDVVIVKKMWKLKMLYAIGKQLTAGYNLHQGGNTDNEEIIYLQTTSLTITNPSLAPLHIDGDPTDSSALINIKILPAAFNLLLP